MTRRVPWPPAPGPLEANAARLEVLFREAGPFDGAAVDSDGADHVDVPLLGGDALVDAVQGIDVLQGRLFGRYTGAPASATGPPSTSPHVDTPCGQVLEYPGRVWASWFARGLNTPRSAQRPWWGPVRNLASR